MKLNMEQNRLVSSKPNGHMLIKGVAGSGKTTVAVHRIPHLLNHYCYGEDDKILMVTYNRTLINYIKYIYSKIEDQDQMSFDDLFIDKKDKVKIYTIDQILYSYFKIYKKRTNFPYELTYDNKIIYNTMNRCIEMLKKQNPNIKILDQKNMKFILDEIDWIKSCNYMELEEYQNVDRLGRTNGASEGPQRLHKNSDTRRIIFQLMNLFDKVLMEQGFIDGKTMALLALKEAKRKVNEKYTHIIVDESQDLTRVQIELLKELYNEKEYSSFCFIADTAQSIYPHSWLVKGRSFSSIGFNMTGKSNSLSKNYRTTTQIAEAAYSLLEKDENILDDENFVKPSLIDRKGEYPVYRLFKNVKDEAEYIALEIKKKFSNGYKISDIAVIAKTRNQLITIKEYLNEKNIISKMIDRTNPNFEDEAVKLLTMHSIKGLEFKVVFICGLNEDIIPSYTQGDFIDEKAIESNERKLLYVGMTRSNELLYLTSSGKPSKFINEINPRYLKMRMESKMRKYYPIQIHNYYFSDKIKDIYSNEEKIRQWVISELINTYNYPKSLIDIEQKVYNFSKVGFVDIVVYIYKNNEKIPYIYIETKALKTGIENALCQLKSYMNVSKTCQYGIVTDGYDLVIINKDFEKIEEIPSFHPSMLPSSIETYTYIDIKHRQRYIFSRDRENSEDIIINREGENEELIYENLEKLNVYGEIVAGVPKIVNEELGEDFRIPSDWLEGNNECFLLKVVGDSMQGADIEYGDYVVVHKQNTAKNMDIVVVTIDENATLKKYMNMGDYVLLIPENENYEPIQMKKTDVFINGVVIGILKSKK
ncbi:3'-5' exonuclease [Defluviitalea phaphyphila]|uniref:3'-5' exonuclease n=1 Tax=Defluviitalea phaphyphila TaxID=1473580 RepID=UPI000730666A|nr:3'-5' exonuclease [Defluviitalea phaphyphila]